MVVGVSVGYRWERERLEGRQSLQSQPEPGPNPGLLVHHVTLRKAPFFTASLPELKWGVDERGPCASLFPRVSKGVTPGTYKAPMLTGPFPGWCGRQSESTDPDNSCTFKKIPIHFHLTP